MSAAYYRGSDGILHRAKNLHIDGGSAQPVVEPLTVDSNGTYNAPPGVDGYNPVNVDVPERTPVIKALKIAKNGVTPLPSDADGYGPVTVAVPSDKKPEETFDRTITENGTYPITPTPGSVFSGGSIEVAVEDGGAPAPFSRIEVRRWTPETDTTYYNVGDTTDLAAVLIFCKGSEVGNSGIHTIACVTDPAYRMDQYGNPVGAWSGKSYGVASGLAAYNYPKKGDIGDDNNSTSFNTGSEYIVVLMYGKL